MTVNKALSNVSVPQAPAAEPAARTLDAVHRAVQSELAERPHDEAARMHLLGVADVLLHRAVLEDLTAARRTSAHHDLEALIRQVASGCGYTTTDPYAILQELAEDLAAGAAPADVVKSVVKRLVAADLPELGSASTPEQEAAATAAMDWLGGEVPAAVSPQVVQDYLATRRTGSRPTVRSVTQLTGGFSKATLLVAFEADGQREEVVLRQVLPERASTGLAAEYAVLSYAYRHGIPAPEPLWLEAQNNPLGGPFFATRRVPGANLGDVFGPRPGTDPGAALGLARALAALHRLDPAAVGSTPVPAMASRDQILARIAEQEQKVARVPAVEGAQARPLQALLFAWLRAHVPEEGFPVVLLHGDPGFHNLLVHQGEVQALLDWERSLVGDPAQDLAYVQPHVLRVVPWAQFLDAYCAAGGVAPDEQRLAYYAVWHDTWRYAGAYRGRARLLADPRAMLDGVTGLLHAPRFLLSALRAAFEVDL